MTLVCEAVRYCIRVKLLVRFYPDEYRLLYLAAEATISERTWAAFRDERCLAHGTPQYVAAIVKAEADRDGDAGVLVFDDATGGPLDLDLRGTLEDCLARVNPQDEAVEPTAAGRRPGRPRLGVVPREVTLLPRHWAWLADQPGGASVALRKLVDGARIANAPEDKRRRAKEAADRFMLAMAGNFPDYEDASRALYAGRRASFDELTEPWPADIRDHARHLARSAFDDPPAGG